MRKLSHHFIFWIVYYLWQVYVEYTLDASSIPNFTQFQKWTGAFTVEIIILPVKLIASYLSFEVIRRAYLGGKEKQNNVIILVQIITLLAVATIVHRVCSNYIAYPLELGRPVRVNFWEPVFLIGSAIDTLFIMVIFIVINFVLHQARVAKKEVQLRKEKLETELHYLRAQINPHFLFNTLNNIYSLSIKKSDLAPEAILKLSKLMRFMLYEGQADRISIHEEISLMEDYIALETMRFNERRIGLTFKKEIDDESVRIAPFILLPFVENAFKHGASESEAHTTIHLNLQLKNRKLLFEIHNTNHNGRKHVARNIGLSNVERQLKIIYRDYHLSISPEEKRFSVTLKINLASDGPD